MASKRFPAASHRICARSTPIAWALADEAKKNACYQEIDEYYLGTVRRGRTRGGRVYMPPFEGILTQEAIWSIKTYLETRREP